MQLEAFREVKNGRWYQNAGYNKTAVITIY